MFPLELKFLEKQMVVREAFFRQICNLTICDNNEKLENVGSLWGSS